MDKDYFLIRRMRQGDEAAVDDFIKRYYSDIYSYCYYKLPNKWQAEDITQETFTNFFRNFNSYIHKGKAKNYLYVIAGNLCKNEYKKHKEIPALEAKESTIAAKEFQKEITLKISIEQEIARLPDELKEVVILHYFQELKLREIAEILGISISLVKYRLSESKKMLKSSMNKEDFYEYSFE